MVTKLIIPSKNGKLEKFGLRSFKECEYIFNKIKPQKYERRPYQLEIIGLLRDALIDRDFKYIFMQLPTGDGKSLTAVTVAEYMRSQVGDYYLLSMDLGLTAQYRNDFDFLREVKGRSNFQCIHPNYRHLRCDEAPCTNQKLAFVCKYHAECPYIIQRDLAVSSSSVLSTPYYIDRCTPGLMFEKRDLAIRDEAHKLEKFYMQLNSHAITESDWKVCYRFESFPIIEDITFWHEKVVDMKEITIARLNLEKNAERLKKYENMIEKFKIIHKLTSDKHNLVIDIEKTDNRGYNKVIFRPVKVNEVARSVIDGVAEKTIFMSATFLSIQERINQLGLDPDDVLYINKPISNFPQDHRRIIFEPMGSMSYKRREKTLPKVIDQCKKIILEHSDKRGIIICGSHAIRSNIANSLQRLLPDPSLVLTHSNSQEFRDNVDEFTTYLSKKCVFITTRFEGLDFSGKIAEYLIYINLPYPPHTDQQISTRIKMEMNEYLKNPGEECRYEDDGMGGCVRSAYCTGCKRWYNLQVAEAIQQALGRIIRTPDDVGLCYILDSRFKKFYNDNKKMFLKYNQKSIAFE